MPPSYELPDYREKSPEVADRFGRIYQRPVVMEVQNLGKRFSTAKGETCALNDISSRFSRDSGWVKTRATAEAKADLRPRRRNVMDNSSMGVKHKLAYVCGFDCSVGLLRRVEIRGRVLRRRTRSTQTE